MFYVTQLLCTGVSEIADILRSIRFRPNNPPAVFTRLLQQCARGKQWMKAREIFQGMEPYQGVVPNRVHYSTLIHVFGVAGKWREAMHVRNPSLTDQHTPHPSPFPRLYCCFFL